MPDEQQARAGGIATFVGCHQIITVLSLPVKGRGEAKIGETLLQIAPHTVNTGFGKGAGVDIHDGLEVRQIGVQHIFGTYHIGMSHHAQITPPALNCSISVSLYPASRSSSFVCSPMPGAAKRCSCSTPEIRGKVGSVRKLVSSPLSPCALLVTFTPRACACGSFRASSRV